MDHQGQEEDYAETPDPAPEPEDPARDGDDLPVGPVRLVVPHRAVDGLRHPPGERGVTQVLVESRLIRRISNIPAGLCISLSAVELSSILNF